MQIVEVLLEKKSFYLVPSTSPRDLTVVHLEENPSAIMLNWQPPKTANGPVTGE